MNRGWWHRERRAAGGAPARIVAALLAAVALGPLLLVAAPAAPAWAHAALTATTPPAGAVLADRPDAVVLTFSEPVRVVAARTTVTGPDGRRADTGRPEPVGATVRIPLRPDGPQGSYLVAFRVSSADGHPIGGGFSFAVGAASPVPPPGAADGAAGPDTGGARIEPAVAVAFGAARYAGYLGLALLTGAALVLAALWPRRLARRDPARLARAGMVLVGLATLAGLYLQAPATTGAGLSGATGADLRDVLASRFGQAHLVRLGVLLVVVMLIRPLLAGRDSRADRWLLTGVGVVGLATWPLSGHAGTAPAPWLAVPADMAHLAAMAVWLGGLIMLVGFLLRRARPAELVGILPRWSRWATVAVAVLAGAGIVQAVIEVGGWAPLTGTTYGRLLLAKVGLLAALLVAAWYARRLVARHAAPDGADGDAPADGPDGNGADGDGADGDGADGADGDGADGDGADGADGDGADGDGADGPDGNGADGDAPGGAGPGRSRLRRAVLVELGVSAVVLGLTAALLATTPARVAGRTAPAPAGAVVPLRTALYAGELKIDPARTGLNDVEVHVSAPGGGPVRVAQWRARASLPGRDLVTEVPLVAIGDSLATGQVNLPVPGRWEFSVTLRTSEIDEATAIGTVPVR